MVDNPFRYLLPVEPEDFVGRWRVVNEVASDLTLNKGDSYAIIAGRRCGKSSLLNAIAWQLCQPDIREKGDCIAMPIIFDFKSVADTIETADAIYAHLLRKIYRSLGNYLHQSPPVVCPTAKPEVTLPSKLINSEEISLDDFENSVKYILGQIEGPNQNMRLVLMLDEIDDTLEHIWTKALFSQLRYLIYSSDIKYQLRLVVTGSYRFLDQVSTHGSPLCNVLKVHYLEPFDEIGLKELTDRAEDLPKEAAKAICLQSGGHPFLAQYLLHHIWEQDINNATESKVGELASKFLAEQTADIEGWARAIDISGLEAYRILASIDDWVDENKIIGSANNPSLNIKRGLIALCFHGFVLHDRGWAKYKCSGNLFKKWFNSSGAAFGASLSVQRIASDPIPFHANLTWLHLSDWHQKGKEFDREVVLGALIEDIKNRKKINEKLDKVDFIIFSGDVAFGGQPEEYKAATEDLFNPILKATGLSPDMLFIIPGNHDLDRTKFKLLPAELSKPLKSNEQVITWLTQDEYKSEILKPFKSFTNFVTSYTGQDNPDYSCIRRWLINNKKMALLGINSAWMCGRGEDDKGSVLVGEPQIQVSLKLISDADIRIAVLHHPFSWLAEFDCDHIERRLRSECDFILYGHSHKPRVDASKSTLGNAVIIPAGASYRKRLEEDPRYTSSYNFVHLDFNADKGTVFLRRWNDERGAWIEDIGAYPGGSFEFSLPRGGNTLMSQRSA